MEGRDIDVFLRAILFSPSYLVYMVLFKPSRYEQALWGLIKDPNVELHEFLPAMSSDFERDPSSRTRLRRELMRVQPIRYGFRESPPLLFAMIVAPLAMRYPLTPRASSAIMIANGAHLAYLMGGHK